MKINSESKIAQERTHKPKILHIAESMGGGVFTFLVDLANQLCDEYDVYIAYGVRQQTPSDFQNYFDSRIKLIKVNNFTRSVDLEKDVKSFFEIRKITKIVNPDIIHLHSSKAGILGRWALNGNKIKVFYTPHGYSFLMQNYSGVKKTIFKTIEKISSKRYCTTISCSYGEHMETLKLTDRATYVNNGIDINALKKLTETPRLDNSKNRVFTVFTLGRICYQKNPELFNTIAERLPNIKFVWIGDGEMKGMLTSPNIEITGWLERDEALRYSIHADVFMLTSRWEGLPISLLESMFMRKICVVSNVIGNKDVINNGENGFVCNEADDFVDVLSHISEQVDANICDRAYQDVLMEYNTIVMGNKYKNIYIN